MRKCRVFEQGYEMWVPEDCVVWTIREGQPYPTILLGSGGWAFEEFDGLLGLPLEEQIKIVEERRQEAQRIMKEEPERWEKYFRS